MKTEINVGHELGISGKNKNSQKQVGSKLKYQTSTIPKSEKGTLPRQQNLDSNRASLDPSENSQFSNIFSNISSSNSIERD